MNYEKLMDASDIAIQFLHDIDVIEGVAGYERQTYMFSVLKIYLINNYGLSFYRKYRTMIEFMYTHGSTFIYIGVNYIWKN